MIKLLNSFTQKLSINNIEVSKIVLIGNMIEIEGVISIIDYSKDLDYDFDYSVSTRDSVEYFTNSIFATDYVIKEIKKIEEFKSGTIVERDEKRYMLVPAEGNTDTFYRLDLGSLNVITERLDKIDLYKRDYYLEGSTIVE